MKTSPIEPGRLDFTSEGLPRSPDFEDVFHAAVGARAQAEHVFLGGNGLPGRWAGRERFVILETGFGLGNNFLATWDTWRRDPARSERLVFVSIDKHPLRQDDLMRAHADSPWPGLAAELIAAWPPLTPNLHPLDFESGRVQLLLGLGDIALLLPQTVAAVDAFFLDGFAPARNADMWDPRVLQRLGRLAAPGATAATWSAARSVREGLAAAGFRVEAAAGIGGKRDISVARFEPRHVATPPPGGPHRHEGPHEALIVGAGLAGCAAAWALGRQGWRCRVIDAAPGPAQCTSGNAAGLFHGSIHGDDGPHARAHRAAALLTARVAGRWIRDGRLPGSLAGCLRLDGKTAPERAAAVLAGQRLPVDYVDWRDRAAARAEVGLDLPSGGWWFAEGGWLSPGAYAACLLEESGATFEGGLEVASVRRVEDGAQDLVAWEALDAEGRALASAPVLVLANGLGARSLLPEGAAGWPQESVRGQISLMDAQAARSLPRPRVPVAGAGYAIPLDDGSLLFGASSQAGDAEGHVRDADHLHNLGLLAGLAGVTGVIGDEEQSGTDAARGAPTEPGWASAPWQGRVGWRAVTPDRLPLVGAVVDAAATASAARADQPRFVPRLRGRSDGLYVFSGLGSRGIAWAALGGQLLASWVTGAPCPLEADLRDALDPARFARRIRKGPG